MSAGWRTVMGGWVSQVKADLACNEAAEERITLVIWRLGQVATDRGGAVWFLHRRVAQVLNAVWTKGLMGAQLPPQVPAGPGLRLPHGGRGVIVHPDAEIGAGCTIYHHVTLGIHHEEHPGRTVGGRRRVAPVLGDDVYLGAGAVVLGPIEVASGTTVGANAVLLSDTEPGTTYVGVPAVARRPREVPSPASAPPGDPAERRDGRQGPDARAVLDLTETVDVVDLTDPAGAADATAAGDVVGQGT